MPGLKHRVARQQDLAGERPMGSRDDPELDFLLEGTEIQYISDSE